MPKTQDPSEVLPGTIFTARQVRYLKWAVIVMGVVLVCGFAFVTSAIVYQAASLRESEDGPGLGAARKPGVALKIPDGMAISHMALGRDRLAVHLKGPEGEEIRIIDLGTGAVLSRIPLKSE